MMPAPMMPDTGATRVDRVERGEQRLHRFGPAKNAHGDARDDRERAFRSDDEAEDIRAGRVHQRAVDAYELAVGHYGLDAEDVVSCEAVLQAMRAAGILRDVPADRADLLARRIRCVVEAVRSDLARDLEVGDARLDCDAAIRNVDVEDAIQTRKTNDQPAGNRQRTSRQPAPVATRHEWHVVAMTETHHLLHLFSGRRQDDSGRSVTEMRQPVTLIGQKFQRFGDNPCFADDAAKLRDERGPKRIRAARGCVHAATPSADSNTSNT